jgi:hypothetical protein
VKKLVLALVLTVAFSLSAAAQCLNCGGCWSSATGPAYMCNGCGSDVDPWQSTHPWIINLDGSPGLHMTGTSFRIDYDPATVTSDLYFGSVKLKNSGSVEALKALGYARAAELRALGVPLN